MNYKQIFAIKRANREKILKVCPNCPDTSGIYILTRLEDGFKYAYIGQAKHILTRLADHLSGYQHIDLSLKKHGLLSESNPLGWKVSYFEYPEEKLDEMEQQYIKAYANAGYQLRNKTSGGQGEGKKGIAENRPSKGYYDGIEQGKKIARRFIADLFSKHLEAVPKNQPPNKRQEKALQKFKDFLEGEPKNENEK